MTDSQDGTVPAEPPKKRSFFKKAAWQTAAKAEEKDIFSHANEFKDIVAEQTKRRQEEKAAKEAERKRKVEEQRSSKRRRISIEDEGIQMPSSESRDSGRPKRENKARSRTPLSPLPGDAPTNSLYARYDIMTRATRSYAEPKASTLIDLGDSDTDPEPLPFERQIQNSKTHFSPTKRGASPREEIEEVEDPRFVALAARARARQRAQNAAQSASAAESTPVTKAPQKAPVVQLFLESEIPDTTPLIVKVRTDYTIEKARLAWCAMQKFSDEMTKEVFLTWKRNQLFDTTTVQRLGVMIDSKGNVSLQGDSNIYTDEDLPKIHLQAWTSEVLKATEEAERAELAAKRSSESVPPLIEQPILEPEPEITRYRLFLKAKGRPDFQISVKADTTFGHLTAAYKKACKIPEEQPITLLFDGERLKTMDTLGDSEIEDMDAIDVSFK